MALLDRLRPQPGWKHPDPSTRISAVESLPDSEQRLFASLAREDESARVRRAAVSRLVDIEALASVARADADPQVRGDASSRLLTIAIESDEAARRSAAAEALDDERQIAQVARSARHQDVASAALARVRESRALGGIARHALHEDVRLRALERIEDKAEIEAVALNTEHKDSGLAAVDRLSDIRVLDVIAERAKNKAVGKRARALVREQEALAADLKSAAEARARRHGLIAEALDLLVRSQDVERGRSELGRLTADWEATGSASAEAAARFEAARGRVADHFSTLERQEQAAAAARAVHEAAVRARRDLIARAAAIDGSDAAGQIAAIEQAWAALTPFDHAEAAVLARELEAAGGRAIARLAARDRAAARRGEIEALAADALQVVEESDLSAARTRWIDVTRKWRELTDGLAVDRELYDRFHAAEVRWREREEAVRTQAARESSDNLARLRNLCDRATALAGMPEASLKDLDHAVRELRAAADHLGPLPSTEQQESFAARVKSLLTQLLPRLRELRETDDWRRWANAGIQEELCKRVEALRQVADPQEVAHQLRDLRRQWKAVSVGRRDEGSALWDRFKSAADDVQVRCDAHFAKLAAEHAQHLAAKQAICDQAEALALSTDWIPTAETLKRLQAEWNTTGPWPKDQSAELARRFRAACDTFFTRRKTDLAERKQVWSGNAQRKEALCGRAEALTASVDWAAAVTEIKQLQAEWKTIGPVRKNRSEALWKRFRGACDTFFERYGRRHEVEQTQRVQERELACQALEALASVDAGAEPPPPDALVATLDDLWKRWHEAPGLPQEQMQPLRVRFEAALGAALLHHRDRLRGTRFDVEAATERRVALCNEVEGLIQGGTGPAELASSSAATLAALLKESLAANTIGGRANEGAKTRAAVDRVRRAQSAWRELGPVAGEEGRALEARFHKACRRFFELHPEFRHPPSHPAHGGPHRDRGGRPPRFEGRKPGA